MTSTLLASDCERMLGQAQWSEQSFLMPSTGEPVIGEDDLFRAGLVAAEQVEAERLMARLSGAHRRKASTHPGEVWFNRELEGGLYDRQQEPARREYMPVPEDENLASYGRRMSALLQGKRFCLRITDVHCYDVTLFRKLARYLGPLARRMRAVDGVRREIRTILFVGDYEYSPFGAHKDPDPQFQQVVLGRRTAHVWTPSCWKQQPRQFLEPWNYLDEAEHFDLESGATVYWPANYYHVFQSYGLSIAVTFSFPEVGEPATEEERAALPSSHGFHNCPAPRAAPQLSTRSRLCGQAGLPILLLERQGESPWTLASNGQLLRLPAAVDTRRIVDCVNSGEEISVRELLGSLLAGVAPERRGEQALLVLELLGALVATHALDVV